MTADQKEILSYKQIESLEIEINKIEDEIKLLKEKN